MLGGELRSRLAQWHAQGSCSIGDWFRGANDGIEESIIDTFGPITLISIYRLQIMSHP